VVLKGMTLSNRRVLRASIQIIAHSVLILGSVLFLFPFFWMVSASFKTSTELLGSAQSLLPSRITWESYDIAFNSTMPLLRNLYNSLFVSINYTVLAVFLCSLAGFAFAKFDFPGKRFLFALMLGTIMVPGVVNIVPSFIVMKTLGWVNTYWSLIIPGAANAFGIFFFRQYIKSAVPDELLDAARMDGCSDFGIYWRIVVPVISPALVTMAIMDFMGTWNDYQWPLIMLRSPDMYTVIVAIASFPAPRFRQPWGAIMAGSTVSVLPPIVLFLLFQKRIISGITIGSVKGA